MMGDARADPTAVGSLGPSPGPVNGNATPTADPVASSSHHLGNEGANMQGEIPFPAERVNGTFTVKYQNLETMTQKTLVSWCMGYGLARSGNKTELKKRLTAFSQDRSQWDSILPGVTRPHRNPRPTTQPAKKLLKQSTRRRIKLFTGTSPTDNPTVHQALPAELANDTRTEAEIAAVLPWARNFMKLHPYPPVPTEPLSGNVPSKILAGMPSSVPRRPCSPTVNNSDRAALQASLNITTATIQQLLACINIQGATSGQSSPLENLSHRLLPHEMPATSLPPVAPSPPPLEYSKGSTIKPGTRFRTLILDDGTKLSFTEDQIPDPPVVSFVTNISRLNRIWDGHAEHPIHDSPLRIQGHPIPLKYWPKVYQYWKGGQWKGTKGKWFEWKVIVHRYRQGTPAEFWEEFSENGKVMSYTSIVARLAEQREAKDLALSNQARAEYGPAFDDHFSYRRGSDMIVLSKPAAIAQRYRDLHSLLD